MTAPDGNVWAPFVVSDFLTMETSLDSSSDSLVGTGFSAAAAVAAFMGTTPCSLSIICLNASISEEHCRKVSEKVN